MAPAVGPTWCVPPQRARSFHRARRCSVGRLPSPCGGPVPMASTRAHLAPASRTGAAGAAGRPVRLGPLPMSSPSGEEHRRRRYAASAAAPSSRVLRKAPEPPKASNLGGHFDLRPGWRADATSAAEAEVARRWDLHLPGTSGLFPRPLHEVSFEIGDRGRVFACEVQPPPQVFGCGARPRNRPARSELSALRRTVKRSDTAGRCRAIRRAGTVSHATWPGWPCSIADWDAVG
jgi:hypothetical protein